MSKNFKDRPRLGRGLVSLMGPGMNASSALPVQAEIPMHNAGESGGVRSDDLEAPRRQEIPATASGEIELTSIAVNPHQPRRSMSEAGLAELAASIRANGVIQPIVVRPVADGFELVAGERRFRAAQRAGLARMPAIVRDIDAHTQAQWALVENIQREDLNPIDRAEAYQTLLTKLGLTQAELAGRLGEERSGIANFLRLLELAPPVREFVRDGRLSMGHAKVLAGVTVLQEQQRIAELAVAQGLSVRNIERLIADAPATSSAREPTISPHLQQLEKSLTRQLGLRVQLRSAAKAGRGRLTIHYGSLDQFDDLMKRLDVNAEMEG